METDIQTFFCNLKQIADLASPDNTLCQPEDLQDAKCFVSRLLTLLQEAEE